MNVLSLCLRPWRSILIRNVKLVQEEILIRLMASKDHISACKFISQQRIGQISTYWCERVLGNSKNKRERDTHLEVLVVIKLGTKLWEYVLLYQSNVCFPGCAQLSCCHRIAFSWRHNRRDKWYKDWGFDTSANIRYCKTVRWSTQALCNQVRWKGLSPSSEFQFTCAIIWYRSQNLNGTYW